MSRLNAARVVVAGNTNSGKSSLVNALIGQEVSIVSSISGTTTDAVKKRFELLDFGPVDLIDTAGLDDKSELGDARIGKTIREIANADLIIYCDDKDEFDTEIFGSKKVIKVKTKADIEVGKNCDINFKVNDDKSKNKLLKLIFDTLSSIQEPTLLEGLLSKGDKVLHIMPIDSEAPKGRLILPQVQMLRECLDKGIISTVIQPEQIQDIDTKQFDLIICDSQVFKQVENDVDRYVMLTSYSILFARQKGDINYFIESAKAISKLKPDSKVLIFESCSHNVSHEDIGTVKIPALLKKHLGFLPQIENKMSLDFPDDIAKYDLVIHCGSCMLGRSAMLTRVEKAKQRNIPMTNYGITIAYINDILERAIKIITVNGH